MDVSIIIPIYKGNGYIESLLNKIEKNYKKISMAYTILIFYYIYFISII